MTTTFFCVKPAGDPAVEHGAAHLAGAEQDETAGKVARVFCDFAGFFMPR